MGYSLFFRHLSTTENFGRGYLLSILFYFPFRWKRRSDHEANRLALIGPRRGSADLGIRSQIVTFNGGGNFPSINARV